MADKRQSSTQIVDHAHQIYASRTRTESNTISRNRTFANNSSADQSISQECPSFRPNHARDDGSQSTFVDVDLEGGKDTLVKQSLHGNPVKEPFEKRKNPEYQGAGRYVQLPTTYGVLFTATITANCAVLVTLITRDLVETAPVLAAAINMLITVVIRQEELINMSFDLVARTPASWPLFIRARLANLHHFGGVHTGTAYSALIWYFAFVVVDTQHFIARYRQSLLTSIIIVDLATCYIFLSLILLICISAEPHMRRRFHNHFERAHRFGSWAALLVLWIHTILQNVIAGWSSRLLQTSPTFWCLLLTTLLVILPWLRIHRVPLIATRVTPTSAHLTLLLPYTRYTSTLRLSHAPLREWHAFATLPCPDTHSLTILVSAAGDWTQNLIASPPSHIWIRNPPTRNFLAFAPLFTSLLLVGTGSGIGPLLSLLSSPTISAMRRDGRRVRVLWVTRDPYAAYWNFIRTIILMVDPEALLVDTNGGRPDMVRLVVGVVKEEAVEAVMVVSNKWVTDRVVQGVRGVGGLGFGAVFDS